MKKDIEKVTDYFEGVDWNTPSIQHPSIMQLQANAKKAQLLAFDDDVVNWAYQQDKQTQQKLNDAIRQIMTELA